MSVSKTNPGFFRRLKIAYYKMASNRRRYLRVPLRVKVTLMRSDIFEFFSSTNISIGGLFVKADNPYAPGTVVKLDFTMGGENNKIVLMGKVVRTVQPDTDAASLGFDTGMGIQFTDLKPKDREAIQKYIDTAR